MYIILGYLWQYITNPKAVFALSLFVSLIAFYNVIPNPWFFGLVALYIVGLIGYLIYWLFQRRKSVEQGEELADAIEQKTSEKHAKNKSKNKEELQLIQQQIKESIQLIRKSKLGDKKGNAALYELPWYMVIGNPAAGKSSAIYNSGLKFPFEETHQKVVSASLSGTRNCDWFFSTEGVLLDTAGRYSVYHEDHDEWLGFLSLLKKNRSKAPINGLIVVVNVAELASQSPEKSLQLAKNLRARIQDMTERLEIFSPVYLIFTKMDLIAGFTEFFECYDGQEFDQVWGATLPYDTDSSQNAVELFDEHYQTLYDGLKSVSTTHLSRRHAQNVSPSMMTFPLEFKTLKPVLKTFIGSLFEDNPYQFKPVFRGFYFTSALQEGHVESPMTEQIAQAFNLQKDSDSTAQYANPTKNQGYFLKNLFSNVILKDKNLVRQHINLNKKRQRYVIFIVALLTAGLLLSTWIWSYRNNQQLMIDVQADLDKVVQMQTVKGRELSTQFDALLILQNRLQQLDGYQQDRPLKLSFGLYQGDKIREKLMAEYLKGIETIVLRPSQQNMAQYLQRLKNNEEALKANHVNVSAVAASATNRSNTQYTEPSDSNAQDGYNALKAYLMLGNAQYIESSHLSDQVTRFWRSWLDARRNDMPRGDMIQKAEQILSYAMTLTHEAHFPKLNSDPQLVDQTRQVLVSVIRGMPARDRVYNEIKMRASVRFPAMTVSQIVGEKHKAVVLGGYALPGIFTQKAWDEYISDAIDQAANKPTDSKDWVLNVNQSDDLSFSGSQDQIRKQLTELYKKEYIVEWKKFLTAIHYAKGEDFAAQAKIIDILGEPQTSPIRTLIDRIAKETSWDNPIVQAELAAPQTGFVAWFKRKVLNQNSQDAAAKKAIQQVQGDIAQAFDVFYQLVRKRDDQQNKSLLDEYFANLSQVRSKFNEFKNAGDVGPSALTLVKQTINEQTTIFNVTQKTIDEKIIVGLDTTNQHMMQQLLASPLTQSFSILLLPTNDEINKLWTMQVYQPFTQTLGTKYPFNASSTIQATSVEIAQVLGETGSVARFVTQTLDPFVIRRGYTLSSKTWKDLGLNLDPKFVAQFQSYTAPAQGVATGGLSQPTAPAAVNQSNFQFYPLQNQKLLSYTLEIDGQKMVYENGVQQWVNFIWPNASAIPGVKITAIDLNGEAHTIFEAPGEYGINRLIDLATRKQLNDGSFEMTWKDAKNPELAVKLNFRLISGNSASTVGAGRGYVGLSMVDHVVTNKDTRIVAAQAVPDAKPRGVQP